jgi:hypothetical protein
VGCGCGTVQRVKCEMAPQQAVSSAASRPRPSYYRFSTVQAPYRLGFMGTTVLVSVG